MKMGAIVSPWRYDAAARHALQSTNLRRPAMLRYASTDTGVKTRVSSRSGSAQSRGCLNFALHEPANIAHGDGEIVLSLQVDPELRSVAEITAEA
jgi:hypothetical protein